VGEEAVATGVCAHLTDKDYITSTHRGHGHLLAKGGDLKLMMAELFGKKTGYCKGKGGSMHIADFNIGFLGANGVVAGGLPIISGAGLSIKLRKSKQVAVAFFGDGASNRGPVHEAMNMAAIWKLPVIFVVENNRYASTTPMEYACSVGDLCTRAAGYGMPGEKVDGNDVLAVRRAMTAAVKRARNGDGPTLLENMTYRMKGHFEGDQQKYRTTEEIDIWREKDPIVRFARRLTEKGILSDEKADQIQAAVSAELDQALAFAHNSPLPEPEDALTDVYYNM
jgi:pyruvate dehydrogenase E1 component alpha subunit